MQRAPGYDTTARNVLKIIVDINRPMRENDRCEHEIEN